MSNVLAQRLASILEIAENVKNAFMNNSSSMHGSIKDVVSKDSSSMVAFDCIAAQGFDCMIISPDPQKLLRAIVERLSGDIEKSNRNDKGLNDSINPINSKGSNDKSNVNPINIMTKLVDSEYMLDVNGARVCYAIRSTVRSSYLMKSFACKNVLTINGYYDCIDHESNTLKSSVTDELSPLFDYTKTGLRDVQGGKKKTRTHGEKKRSNIRREIIERIVDAVRSNSEIAKGLIFVQQPSECSDSAIDIIFTDMLYKNALVNVISDIVTTRYSKTHSTKTFLHADSVVPYEFRLKKYTCILNNITTKQPVYVANIYNIATYMPVPCVHDTVRDAFVLMAHPLVRLRFLYIDMFMMEHKLGIAGASQYERLNLSKLTKVFNEVKTYDKSPTWVGFYADEAYARNKYNMKMKMSNPVETFLI